MSVPLGGMIRLKDCFARDRLSSGTTCVLTSFLCKPDGRVRLSPSANATDHSGVSADASSGASCVTHAKPAFYSWLCPIFPTHGTKVIATTSISCPKLLGFSTNDAIGHAASTGPFCLQLYRSHHVRRIRGGGIEQPRTPSDSICHGRDFTAPHFLLWAKLCASFSQCMRLHYKSFNLVFAAISMTSTLSQLHP